MNDLHTHPPLFQELQARLDALDPKDALKLRRDRWLFAVALVGFGLTLPSILGLNPAWSGWLVLAGLPIELCALALLVYRQVRDTAPDFIDAKRKYAVELDTQFVEYERIRRWLHSLAPSDRRRRLAYVEARLERMMERYPIVFGAADKLGVLPALIGLFLQWQAIKTVSLSIGVVGGLILLLYGMALWMAGYRLQLQGYCRLLKAAEAD